MAFTGFALFGIEGASISLKKVECIRILKLLYVKKFAAIVHLVLDNDADSFEHMDMPVRIVVEGVRQGLEEF